MDRTKGDDGPTVERAIELAGTAAHAFAVWAELGHGVNGLAGAWLRHAAIQEKAAALELVRALSGRSSSYTGEWSEHGDRGPSPAEIRDRTERAVSRYLIGPEEVSLRSSTKARAARRLAELMDAEDRRRRSRMTELVDHVFVGVEPATPIERYEHEIEGLKADDTLTPEEYGRAADAAYQALQAELAERELDDTDSLPTGPSGWDDDGDHDTLGADLGTFFDPATALDDDTKEDTNR